MQTMKHRVTDRKEDQSHRWTDGLWDRQGQTDRQTAGYTETGCKTDASLSVKEKVLGGFKGRE